MSPRAKEKKATRPGEKKRREKPINLVSVLLVFYFLSSISQYRFHLSVWIFFYLVPRLLSIMRLLLYFLPALLPALAAPTESTDEPDVCEETGDINNPGGDEPTHDGSAGLGFEFESVMFKFKSDGCSMDHTNEARKNLVANRKGNNWILTADTGDDPGKVNAEYIVDGTQVKVGQNMAGPIGKDIADDLVSSSYTGIKFWILSY